MLRRNQKKSPPEIKLTSVYQFGTFSYNIQTKQLLNQEEAIKLTSTEAKLLTIFVQNPNKELSRDFLSTTLKGYEHDPFDRSIDVLVKRVRAKIELNTSTPEFIMTVWGKGYQFIPVK